MGKATARKDEPGARAAPALKTGTDEGGVVGAGCWIRGVERMGTGAGGV